MSVIAAGINALIGDPGRAYLPRPRLRLLAEYRVSDFGEVKGAAMKPSAVFSLEPDKGHSMMQISAPPAMTAYGKAAVTSPTDF
jgi:hypothetical protein